MISIIIPVYNQEKELQLALQSIKNQTYKDVEVIIERDEKHEGAPVMRNRGLMKAKGEYVIFWDADVVAVPQMLGKMKEALDKNLQASFAYCDHDSHIISHMSKKMPAKPFNFETLKENNYIHSTSLIRRSDAIRWDENLKRFQDWDLWLTMAENNKIGVYIPETLFSIVAKGTMSSWLPRLAYQKPWRYLPGIRKKIKNYEQAKEVIIKNHSL